MCVPSWPWYNRHPVKWLPVPEGEDDVDGKDSGDEETERVREREPVKQSRGLVAKERVGGAVSK